MRPLEFILNTLFPPRCSSCKQEGAFLCKSCQKELKIKPISPYKKKEKEFEYLDGVIYGMDYEENPAVQAAVKQFKYKYTKELGKSFAKVMNTKIGELNMTKNKDIELVPVPLHKKRYNQRGFNQAEVLVDYLAKEREVEITPVLKRIRNTSQQAKLKKEQRHLNLKNAFLLNTNFVHKKDNIIFLVDDICTTGATLENCAKALKNGGAEKVYGLVIARANK